MTAVAMAVAVLSVAALYGAAGAIVSVFFIVFGVRRALGAARVSLGARILLLPASAAIAAAVALGLGLALALRPPPL
jgi:hypothetical protein